MLSNFAVIRVKLIYMPTEEKSKSFPGMNEILADFTRQIFGYVEEIEDYSMYLFLSKSSNLFDLKEFIVKELLNLDVFEGLEFEIIVEGAVI